MITFRFSTEVNDDRQVVVTLPPEVPPGKTDLVITVEPQRPPKTKRPRRSLVEWAEQNAEHWGDKLNSADVEGFTGRRF